MWHHDVVVVVLVLEYTFYLKQWSHNSPLSWCHQNFLPQRYPQLWLLYFTFGRCLYSSQVLSMLDSSRTGWGKHIGNLLALDTCWKEIWVWVVLTAPSFSEIERSNEQLVIGAYLSRVQIWDIFVWEWEYNINYQHNTPSELLEQLPKKPNYKLLRCPFRFLQCPIAKYKIPSFSQASI